MTHNRQDDIIEAAGKCFVKFGYDKTTLDDISEMVGINKASFYYYFKSKEDIFSEVITREADVYMAATVQCIEAIPGCREKILAWIKEGFSYNRANSILNRLSLESLRHLSPRLTALMEYAKKKGTDFLVELFRFYQRKGDVVVQDADKLARTIQNVIYAMKDNAYLQARSGPDGEVDLNALRDEIMFAVSLILDGVVIRKRDR